MLPKHFVKGVMRRGLAQVANGTKTILPYQTFEKISLDLARRVFRGTKKGSRGAPESELLELALRDSFSERDRSEPQIRFRGDREEEGRASEGLFLSSWEWVKMSARTNAANAHFPRKRIRSQLFAANGFLGGVVAYRRRGRLDLGSITIFSGEKDANEGRRRVI